jgi:hypothetical protein
MPLMFKKISIKVTSEKVTFEHRKDSADVNDPEIPSREVRVVEIRTLGRGSFFGSLRRKPKPA